MDMTSLTGRSAIVTGGAGRIGGKIAEVLLDAGASVLLVDIDQAGLDESAQSFDTERVRTLVVNLEKVEDALIAIRKSMTDDSDLAVLVNNAAFVGTSDLKGWAVDFEAQDIDTWRRAIDVNLTAAFALCQSLAPELAASGHGSIINIGSIYGVVGQNPRLYDGLDMACPAAYGASKGGLLMLTRHLATTLAPDVRVNMLSPGGILRGQPEKFVNRYEQLTPLGRMGREEDIQGAALFLASDMSGYITGQNIVVDGGWTVW